MGAQPYRSTVTIDGTSFNAVSTKVSIDTAKDQNGLPTMGSLTSTIQVLVDLQDTKNVPFTTIKKLFTLANVPTNASIKDMKIEFWQDDAHENAICSYGFKGWISKFETSNPMPNTATSMQPQQMMVLNLQPSMTDTHYPDFQISN